jgi:hypothetical protein
MAFELADRIFSQRHVTMKIVGVEDRLNVADRMPGDRRDLRHGASGKRKPQHCGSSEIVERETVNPALATAFRHEALKPSDVHVKPACVVRIVTARRTISGKDGSAGAGELDLDLLSKLPE